MSLTARVITEIRELIRTGELQPGSKLPPEQELAARLGVGRNLLREAVQVLAASRVLEIRRGNGTYVTTLEPRLLLEGVGAAVELIRADDLLELTEVRRLFEPAATALAAVRITPERLLRVHTHLDAMHNAANDVEQLNLHDAAFHREVIAATENETLTALLEGISSRTVRSRVWRGLVDTDSAWRTLADHQEIYAALAAGDAALAHAAALMHVHNTERWLRNHLPE
ncbi:FCD domain-containing protein [Pseudonocardia sp. DSM 110487]|uniref:FadR/GntR family transcriptional regulator n=1 Tax=Pseudonocardia sp. DSM 110487 TaxID=2865833 RepID=UPI001C6A0DB7|nr:FCD domain-containing protein [Pseudonocardia sp. DSM 110487]QYN34003.1 FCD domain-containing protein [Pseudonocardia sp. DSM 110487]